MYVCKTKYFIELRCCSASQEKTGFRMFCKTYFKRVMIKLASNGTVGTTSRFLYGTRKSLRADYTHKKLDRRQLFIQ
jgi:hypothetical protein